MVTYDLSRTAIRVPSWGVSPVIGTSYKVKQGKKNQISQFCVFHCLNRTLNR